MSLHPAALSIRCVIREDDDQENRLEYTPDTKIPNAGLFKLNKEDHTMGNLLRMQLLRDNKVRFAGYKVPHPLIHSCHIKVQTMDSMTNPVSAFESALQDLSMEVDSIETPAAGQCCPPAACIAALG